MHTKICDKQDIDTEICNIPSRCLKWEDKLRTLLYMAAIFCDFFLDFGPIYKVINKSAQEKSPEEKKTWGDNPSLVQNITSSVSTLRQLNTTMASKKILKEYVFGVLTGINDWLIDCDTEICDKEDIDTKICEKQDIDTKHVSIFLEWRNIYSFISNNIS